MKKISLVSLMCAVAFWGCNKDSDKAPESPFRAVLVFANTSGPDTVTFTVNSYGRAGGVIDTTGNYFEIQSTAFSKNGKKISFFFMKTFSGQPDHSEIESIFHLGNYTFGSSVDSLKDGVEIIYEDAGLKWSSAYGTQTGGFFEVTEHSENNFDNYTPFATSASFACTLYDSTGNSLPLHTSTFNGRTIVYP